MELTQVTLDSQSLVLSQRNAISCPTQFQFYSYLIEVESKTNNELFFLLSKFKAKSKEQGLLGLLVFGVKGSWG